MSEEDKSEGSTSFSLLNAKDLAGISAPLVKLIDTVGNAGGRVSSGIGEFIDVYLLDKKKAENEAHRIMTVGAAQTHTNIERAKAIMELIADNNQAQLQTMTFDVQNTSATLAGVPIEIKQLQERASKRVLYENVLHELNRDSITNTAAQELAQDDSISSEPVDPDWTTRFFNIAQDVSSEEMHILFGKVLAGEIKKPGSYSMRTLDVLKNLSTEEALAFKKAANYVVKCGEFFLCEGNARIATSTDFLYLTGLNFQSIEKLSECGLLHANSAVFYSGKRGILKIADKILPYDNGSRIDTMPIPGQKPVDTACELRVRNLTNAGVELYRLIESEVVSPISYIRKIKSAIISSNEPVLCHYFHSYGEGDIINYHGEIIDIDK